MAPTFNLAKLLGLAAALASLPLLDVANAQQQGGPPPAVLVQPAELRSLNRMSEFVGRVQALDKVDLRARVQGFLGPRLFQDGDQVKEGQRLFTIEREPFEAVVEQRKAQVAAAEATLQNAEQQMQRAQDLLRTNNIPQATVDQRAAELSRAKAGVLEAEAALKDAEIKLSYTVITSPIAGRIGRASVSPGNLVGPDSGVLATVVREDPVQVVFAVSQREMIEGRRTGARGENLVARVKLADGSMYKEPGKIDFLDVQVDPRTDGQTVRALFPNPGQTLTDGQTVRVLLEQLADEKVVTIPSAAVAIDQTGPYVFVVTDDNVAEQRRVRLGATREGFVAVEEGIKPGEKVVVAGQQRVRNGIKVAPSPAQTPRS